MKRVTVSLVINGQPCCATQVVDSLMWENMGYRLALLQRLTQFLIDEATKGVEPRVRVEDVDQDELLNLQPLEPVARFGILDVESR